jgi:hypothetical protein
MFSAIEMSPGQLDVKWLECLGGFHQEQWRLGSGAGRKLDLASEPLDPAPLHTSVSCEAGDVLLLRREASPAATAWASASKARGASNAPARMRA